MEKNKSISLLSVTAFLGLIIATSMMPQASAFGIGFPFRNDHDLTHDGLVDKSDMIMLLNLVGATYNEGDDLDFNDDQLIDESDMNIFLSTLGNVQINNNADVGTIGGLNGIPITPLGNSADVVYVNTSPFLSGFWGSGFYSPLFGPYTQDVSVDLSNGLSVRRTLVRL